MLPIGSLQSTLLIVGLAPGLKGANRTGLPFDGDDSGTTLSSSLARLGMSTAPSLTGSTTGQPPVLCRITNAVRCVPPHNKPTPAEIAACRPYLAATIADLPRLAVILALGRVAHACAVRTLGAAPSSYPFAHAAEHRVGRDLVLLDSYHCSRYNVRTGRLTTAMLDDVVARARDICRSRAA